MKYVINQLRRHLWRTLTGISGYVISALFILLVLSVTRSNERDSLGILKGTGTHFIVYIPSDGTCCVSCDSEGKPAGGSLFAEGVYTMMLNSDLITAIKKIDGVRDAAPYLLYKLYDDRFKTEISLGGIDTVSIATENNVCAATNLIAGRFLSDKPDEIVAEQSFAMAHNLSVGDTLNIYGGKLVLAGLINSGIKPGKADLYAPIENVRSILKEKLNCISPGFDMNIVLVEVSDSRIQNRVMDQMKKEMNYLSVSSYNCYEPAADVMGIIEKSSTLLTIMVFLFLIIFATKTQITSLRERFRELGILKSLGWSDFQLSTQILFSSLIQSLIGVTIGCLIGGLTIVMMSSFNVLLFNMLSFQFQISSVVPILLLSLAGGIIAGILPIVKLYRTKAGDMINDYL